jgi:hypothetical protein
MPRRSISKSRSRKKSRKRGISANMSRSIKDMINWSNSLDDRAHH